MEMEMEMEMEDEKKRVLEDVFGESSSPDSDTFPEQLNPNPNPNWIGIEPIKGLWLCPDFLTSHQQSSFLSDIHNEGWFTEESHNQAMRFGDLPSWAVKLSGLIYEAVCIGCKETDSRKLTCDNEVDILPPQLLGRDPLFDQLIVNVYQPRETADQQPFNGNPTAIFICSSGNNLFLILMRWYGCIRMSPLPRLNAGSLLRQLGDVVFASGICAHIDLMRFEDGIAIVSLESPCVMHFSPVETIEKEVPLAMKIPIHLTPGSLVIMWGEARYKWKHEINRKPGFQVWRGREIEQDMRTSVTLRRLCNCE